MQGDTDWTTAKVSAPAARPIATPTPLNGYRRETRGWCDFPRPGTCRQRHRRSRADLLRRSFAGAAVLADDTAPRAAMTFIMAGWTHPAMPDPAEETITPRMQMVYCLNGCG